MNKYVREFLLWILISLPYVYLAMVWNELPDVVPTHFNLEGQADAWSDKSTLLWLPGVMGLGIYVLMLIVPYLDPKGRIQQMGNKYHSLRIILSLFFSAISCYILYVSSRGNMESPQMIIALMGLLFAVLGNYFQTMRPNYFIGIRTPWTLENEEVWKKTHRLAGKLWLGGGLIIAVLAFFLKTNSTLAIIFGSLLVIMVLVPVVYSWLEFRTQKNQSTAVNQD